MKINKLSVAIVGSILYFSCGNPKDTAETTTTEEKEMTEEVTAPLQKSAINTTTSTIKWKGEMMGMYSHSGTLAFNNGEIAMENGNIVGGSFEANMSSMTPTDENYDASKDQTPEKLVGHLSSPDFFDVENHPTASFTINSVDGNVATGMLTIRGKSNEEKVENVVVSEEDGNVTLTGTLTFDRKKYDVAFDHPLKEMVLSNDVTIEMEIHTGE